MSTESNSPVQFTCGATMKNRFALAPMTNSQSFENGQLSDDELHWLEMRAKGQFGMVMTCASHVQEIGKGFPGQLGIFSDELMDGHKRLTKSIQQHGSLAVIQLHHAGLRSPEKLIGEAPVSPSDSEKHGSRALALEEVHQLRDDFISAAIRSQQCGYDGIEVHGAHGYIICQFLSSEYNQRTDEYGGTLTNRARLLFEIVDGIRNACGKEFLLGVRLSPERFGMVVLEIKEVCARLIADGNTDFLDISLWDCFKYPEDEAYKDHTLLEHFTSLDYKHVKWTVAGKIRNGEETHKILDAGVDFVSIGRSAILHHNFPQLVMDNPAFVPVENPVSKEHLRKEGLGEAFVTYMSGWPGFVQVN